MAGGEGNCACSGPMLDLVEVLEGAGETRPMLVTRSDLYHAVLGLRLLDHNLKQNDKAPV